MPSLMTQQPRCLVRPWMTRILRGMSRQCGLVASVCIIALIETPARAEDANVCANAYEHAQTEGRAGRPRSAREAAHACTVTCPRALASDCARWAAEFAVAVPSFVVRAHDEHGARISANLELDNAPVATGDEPIEAK